MNRILCIFSAGLLLGAVACRAPGTQPAPRPTGSPSALPSPHPTPSPVTTAPPSASPKLSPPPTDRPSPTLPVAPLDGLVAYYPFEGNADSHDHLHDGRSTEGMLFEPGIKGKAAFFLFGSTQSTAIYLDDDFALKLSKAFSISVWNQVPLYPENRATEMSMPLVCGIEEKQWGMGLFWTPGGADVFLHKAQPDELWLHRERQPKPELQTSAWHHSLITYDGKELRIYLDGRLDLATSFVSASQDYGIIDAIGNCPSVGENDDPKRFMIYEGLIDELRVYSRVVSASEVQAIYYHDRQVAP